MKAALAAAAVLFTTGAADAMTPALLDPQALAGTWVLTKPGLESCRLTLKTDPVESADGFALDIGTCKKISALTHVTNWRVAPDGIALAEADRTTVYFMSKHGENLFKGTGKFGGGWTMTRG